MHNLAEPQMIIITFWGKMDGGQRFEKGINIQIDAQNSTTATYMNFQFQPWSPLLLHSRIRFNS